MKKYILFVFSFLLSISMWAEQLPISRIEQMSNMPTPYQMRDWKQTTIDYDNFIFDISKTGTYLPLSRIVSTGINYPDVPQLYLDTYVGHYSHSNMAEGINVLPAIVGASLVGVDKTNHLGNNWVKMAKNYYNKKNGVQLYLNHFNVKTGNSWWYQTMPNVFFYQLYDLYPDADTDFEEQFISVANQHLESLKALGAKSNPWTYPYMNYLAFNFETMLPTSGGVPQTETAGAYGWMLYQAYLQTGDTRYLNGAEWALDFLQNWNANPSYELQLPYGIITAARMNAEQGTNYNLQKFMDWAFSSGEGTLRKWGCIIGNWGGYDVSGLIGEANDKGNDYAFLMNGFQHAAALLPVAKYDKRYARALAKWLLNMANASRLFYPDVLPQSNQQADSYNWSVQYDPGACIPYESMKEKWNNKTPFAMGDAVKGSWGETDLSLYTGSGVGYMAALIENTNVEGVLQIDLNKTDFRGENKFPNYLYYNPHASAKSINMTLPAGLFTIYDAISETVLSTNTSGDFPFTVDADNVRLLVVYPSSKTTQLIGRKLQTTEGETIDYHYRYNYTNPLRVKSFSTNTSYIEKGESLQLNCFVENASGSILYEWFADNSKIGETTIGDFNWVIDVTEGIYQLKCKITSGSTTVESAPLKIEVNQTGEWIKLGSDISDNTAAHSNIAIAADGTPYVVLIEGGSSGTASNKLTVKKYTGSQWELVGDRGFSNVTKRGYPAIMFDRDDNLLIGHAKDPNFAAVVYIYKNSAWSQLGDPVFEGVAGSSFINLACDSDNNIYVAFVNAKDKGKVCVKKWNSTDETWDNVGVEGFSAGNANYLRLAVDANDIPYVAFVDADKGNKISVMKYDASNGWEYIGVQGFSSETATPESDTTIPKVDSFLGFGIDGNNTIYVAYRNNTYKPIIESYSNETWNVVGSVTTAASNSAITCLDFTIGKNNIPYLIYRDNLSAPTTYSAVVQKFIDNAWTPLNGINGFTSTANNFTRIAVDKNTDKVYSSLVTNNKTQVWIYSSEEDIATVKNTLGNTNDIHIYNLKNNEVMITNLPMTPVFIYNTSGILINQIINHQGYIQMKLPEGIYIAKYDKGVQKFIVF